MGRQGCRQLSRGGPGTSTRLKLKSGEDMGRWRFASGNGKSGIDGFFDISRNEISKTRIEDARNEKEIRIQVFFRISIIDETWKFKLPFRGNWNIRTLQNVSISEILKLEQGRKIEKYFDYFSWIFEDTNRLNIKYNNRGVGVRIRGRCSRRISEEQCSTDTKDTGSFSKGTQDDRIFYFSAIPRQMIVRVDGPL